MNKTEEWYYKNVLLLRDGVQRIEYEGIRFQLANGSTYTPDFYVLLSDGTVEIHETKGFWREDDRVKIKVAAHRWWEYRWFGVTISGFKIKKVEEFI